MTAREEQPIDTGRHFISDHNDYDNDTYADAVRSQAHLRTRLPVVACSEGV